MAGQGGLALALVRAGCGARPAALLGSLAAKCPPRRRPLELSSIFGGGASLVGRAKTFQEPWLTRIQSLMQGCIAALPTQNKEQLLKGVSKDHILLASRVLDQAVNAASQWSVQHTDFLTPPARGDVLMVLNRLTEVGAVVSGGYAEAERCRLSVGNLEALELLSQEAGEGYPGAVAAIKIAGNFAFDSAAHGDFLGAVLGTGIKREKVGDIIVQGDRGAQVILVPELVEFLMTSLTQVRSVPVALEQIPLSDIEVMQQRVSVLTSVESSLRVDSLASAGFKMSRTKLADLISGGDVRVNWKEISKNGVILRTGDVVSVRGKGRLEIGDISLTKKGRYAVELKRYT